ncbi:hypothetical protein NEF87_000584 [Candidatus Lokiarchaeum ossiferum]|uniref:Intracellular proteinase inhibitor BsuPI domain-containing protein n=1 Tax=Candidatus Lokiarchaeum ossiferum TaxID=2951803 RepID=A0ABY6HP24_9ARCH|nr:hypothetical protein NEF87_000584 [Candidatus Lokiarchaeum sp. B-35]
MIVFFIDYKILVVIDNFVSKNINRSVSIVFFMVEIRKQFCSCILLIVGIGCFIGILFNQNNKYDESFEFLESDLSMSGILEIETPEENKTEYLISKLEITIKSESIEDLKNRFTYDNIEFRLHTLWVFNNNSMDWIFTPNTLMLNFTKANLPTLNDIWYYNIFAGDYELSDPEADNIEFSIRLKDTISPYVYTFPATILTPILV